MKPTPYLSDPYIARHQSVFRYESFCFQRRLRGDYGRQRGERSESHQKGMSSYFRPLQQVRQGADHGHRRQGSTRQTLQARRRHRGGVAKQEIRFRSGRVSAGNVLPVHHPIRRELRPQILRFFGQKYPPFWRHRRLPRSQIQILLLQRRQNTSRRPDRDDAADL